MAQHQDSIKKIEDPTHNRIFTLLQVGHKLYIQKGGYISYERERGKYIYHIEEGYNRAFDDINQLALFIAFDHSQYFTSASGLYPPTVYRGNNDAGSTSVINNEGEEE